MLANGITLGFKTSGGSTYTVLADLKEVPEFGAAPEKVEVTTLSDTVKKYEFGIGDYGDLEYTFKYSNTPTSPYRVLRGHAENKEPVMFEQTYPDGTKFQFEALVNIKLGGGGVNAAIDFKAQLALQSDITVVDPT